MSSVAQFSANFDNASDFHKPKYEYQPVEGPIDFLNPTCTWGLDSMSPVERAVFNLPPREGYKLRIRRWLRQVAKAEGREGPPEDKEDQTPRLEKRGWSYVAVGDWASCPSVNDRPDPNAEYMVDPKLLANFQFVEKTARKRKLSEWDSRRLHIVFRAPTEEKINRIHELIRVLLPFVEEESRMPKSSRSQSP